MSPKCADGKSYCEDIESYPYDFVDNLIQKSNLPTELFFKEEVPNKIVNRNSLDESYICASSERTIFPKIAKNKRDEWKYIINQGDKNGYVQGVVVETCRSHGRPCELFGSSLPEGYTTECKQKYTYRRLISITDSGQVVHDSFQMPSACCCSYRRNYGFLTSFGKRMASPLKVNSNTTTTTFSP